MTPAPEASGTTSGRRRPARTGRVVAVALVPVLGVPLVGVLSSGASADDPSDAPRAVSATAETEPVPHRGDAADDPAVWVDPRDPARSAVIATDKEGGLLVYDLSGEQLQYLPVGRVNNVDVRSDVGDGSGFRLDGERVSLVTTGNRSDDSIGVHVMDPQTRQLRDVSARRLEVGLSVYGSCMYRSAATGRTSVFVNSKSGQVEQWELFERDGQVDARRVRSFDVGTQTEGCVADDELGHLYIGEEERGIWKYGAEPEDGSARTLVAAVGPDGPLVADVEGLALAYGPDGTGHLIASSQGSSSYVVYRREGDNDHVSSFRIVRGDGVDSVRDTDGIDVTTADLGPAFPHGVLVAQDGRNDGGRNQNFKLVPLEDVLPALVSGRR